MKDNFISQSELDSLLRKNEAINGSSSLSHEDRDILSEVGNVTLAAVSESLTRILKKKVSLLSPEVRVLGVGDIQSLCVSPKAACVIELKGQMEGASVMLIEEDLGRAMAGLLMVGTAERQEGRICAVELDALYDAFERMSGEAFHALAEMTDLNITTKMTVPVIWDQFSFEEVDSRFGGHEVCSLVSSVDLDGMAQGELHQILTMNQVEMILTELKRKFGSVVAEGPKEVKSSPAREEVVFAMPVPEASDMTTSASQPEFEIQKPVFPPIKETHKSNQQKNLDLIMDVPLDFSVVLGKTRRTIKDILTLETGSVVELNKLADEPLEIYVNGKLVAHGEVVVISENFGVRITQILSREQRVQGLK